MNVISLNNKFIDEYVEKEELNALEPFVKAVHKGIHEKNLAGSEFLGWLQWASKYDETELQRLEQTAAKIRDNMDVLVVIGIGGSYLGTKAVQELLSNPFTNKGVEVIFAGQNISDRYMEDLLRYIEGKEVAVNVISKSGTTTEPAIAFRKLRKWMEDTYGDGASERIIATTDSSEGALRKSVDKNGYVSFEIPPDIGGRYSVLTPVGLFPLAVAGIDIRALIKGAVQAEKDLDNDDVHSNPAYQYAAYRQILNARGYSVEVLASVEPSMASMHEWWKQLFGESEGKQGKGVFPASVVYSTDLHSLGQYLQNGKRFLFETMLCFTEDQYKTAVPMDEEDVDGLNYLSGKTFHEVNQQALDASAMAHAEGGVPILYLEMERIDAFHAGYLLYFFMKSCAMSAYLSGVNPFDQPGVEFYKQNMFQLLGKPGY